MLLAGSSSAWGASLNTNTGDNRASGVEVQYNSTSKWYRIGSVSNMWNNGCTPKMSGSQNNPLDSHNFGTVTTLKLKGGEVNTRLNDCNSGCNDYAEARYSYKIYKINASEPSSYTTGFTANTWECGSRWDNASDVSIYNSANIDLLSGLGAGDYNLKMKMEIQARWSGGTYGNTWTHTASATFTVPGYSTTTGDKDFGEVDVNSSSDYTIELTHYGSDNTATVSITGTNKSEFTATVTKNGDDKQILTVTFKPTSVDQNKTATIKVTDAYNKTYTLTVTGTGKQSCQAPTSVSITRSDAPSTANICQGSTINLTAAVTGGSGNISYVWTKTSGSNDWTIDNASAYECTVSAGTGSAQFTIQATQCEKTVEATITLTADPKPNLELTSSSVTICQGTEITLSNYVNNDTKVGDVKWYSDENRGNEITNLTLTPIIDENKYYARATNGVCTTNSDKTLTVTVVSAPKKPTLNTNDNVLATGESATLTIGNTESGVTYTLYKNGESTSKTAYASPYTFTNITEGGLYKVKGTNNNPSGCEETEFSDEVTIEICPTVPTPELSIEQEINDNCGKITNGIISISNYASFEGCTFTLNGNDITPTNEGKIEVTASGTYTVVVTNSCGNSNTEVIEMTKTTIRAPRTDFEVSLSYPQVAFDQNNGSVNIDLSGSERNVTYYLYKNGVKVDGSKTLSSEGKALRWTVSESGTYTVKADNPCNGEIAMTGSVDFTCMSNLNIAFEGDKTVFCPNETANIIVTFDGTGKGDENTNPGKYGWKWTTNNITYTSEYLSESGVKVPVTITNDGSISLSVKSCGGTVSSNTLSFTTTPAPTTPTVAVLQNIEKCGSDITKRGKIQITSYNAAYTYKIDENVVSPNNSGEVDNLSTAGTFTLYAINECEVKTPSETFTITETDNKPTVSISGNTSAVFYEDVTLTATATAGATIKWYEDAVEKATGATYVVTSATETSKTVTAKAFLNGCESAEATKTVKFSEETCEPTTITVPASYIEIYCKYNDAPTQHDMKVDIWKQSEGQGTESYQSCSKSVDGYAYWKFNITDDANYCIRISNKELNYKSGSMCTLTKGHKYYFDIPGGWSGWTSGPDKSKTKDITETQDGPPAISAPAAKTISVSTTDGEGNIIFSGQVVKTGCDATNEYGFQYSSDEQTWTTVKVGVNAAAGTVISNNTVKGLDGIYYVRAYITNDNSTQYGAVTEITVSTRKEPISSVVLTHVKDVNGTAYEDQELENLTYCVGDEVWFELNYVGSTFIPENNVGFKWTTYPGNGLIGAYNGNKYKFTITGSGTIGISLRNEANVDLEGNPTWIESNLLEFNTHPEPTAPTISFATATICSNDDVGATLTLGATVSGQAYELWKYANDDDTEGSKVANVATLNCTENNQALQFSGIKTAGKYFVKTYYTAFCNTVIANSSYATLTVVNAEDVSISINPAAATTTPWMPVKLTISATDDYTLEVPEGVEFSQNGDICSVKIPLPDGATGGEGQYENVSFPQDATTSYTVTANLVSTGGENNPCAVPATATITLTPYVEECTKGH